MADEKFVIPGPLDQEHEQHKVRLSGFDPQENLNRSASKPRKGLCELAYGRSVFVEWRKRDGYGLIVGKVFEGGREYRASPARAGVALPAVLERTGRPRPGKLRHGGNREARAARRDLWTLPEAQRVYPRRSQPPRRSHSSRRSQRRRLPLRRTSTPVSPASRRPCSPSTRKGWDLRSDPAFARLR